MLVSHVIGDCPGCGGVNKYGNVSVGKHGVVRGCRVCNYKVRIALPTIRKKILYLDQFFLSSAFRDKDERYVTAAKMIADLAAKQLLVAPYSSIHEDETYLWRGFDGKNREDLMEFIKSTSRGHKFEASWNVEQSQLSRAFESFLAGSSSDFKTIERDIVKDDVHAWDDYFWIDVGGYIGDIELNRQYKNEAVEELLNAIDVWRTSVNTFQHDVTFETNSAAREYFNSYIGYATRIVSGDTSALFNAPLISSVVESLLFYIPDEASDDEKLNILISFFKSDHFRNAPRIWIRSRIYAVFRKLVQAGAYKNKENTRKRLSGFFKDVEHISTYAPYCDAFVMDQPMAALVRDGRLNLEEKYAVNVFTLNEWDVFYAWLENLNSGITNEHKIGLQTAYPWMNLD